uniref:Survival Motor Neuron Gemin2-binding domain-containing protein n=1 Tax=Ananas comosus var. bracteatus TaxID=296719 RepID=A0A6V7QQQ8_ANACO|nr:unnamed protein product [Ananas comosus var. bracteatus]
MGKGTDLWDDSALVDAFDHAMATYKEMHSRSNRSSSFEEEKKTDHHNESSEIIAEHIEPDDNNNYVSNNATEISLPGYEDGTTTEELPIQETIIHDDLQPTESHTYSSGFVTYEKVDNYNQQNVEYNELLRQYYELEEKRQKVLQHLQQTNYWNYQTQVQSSASEAQQLPMYNSAEYGLQLPCASSACYYLSAPVIPISCCGMNCSLSGSCGNLSGSAIPSSYAQKFPGAQFCAQDGIFPTGTSCKLDSPKQSADGDDTLFKAGLMAAESAVNSVKTKISALPISFEGKNGKEKEESTSKHESMGSQGINSETDLSVVLNAWYSAGFHTGRYLLEQSWKASHK